MLLYGGTALAAMVVLLAGATAVDITAELNSGWVMGLRPRQVAQNLQAFSGAVGGVSASAVSVPRRLPAHEYMADQRDAPRKGLGWGPLLTEVQITDSGDPERPFAVDGDTFVGPSRRDHASQCRALTWRT